MLPLIRGLQEGRMIFRVSFVALALALLCTSGSAGSDLDRAYRIISGKQFVDLTHSFGPTTPVWSGFGQADFTPAFDPKTKKPYTIKDDGFRTTYYNMVGQYSTHVDPPAHFAKDGVTMDKIPLKQMILPLIVLDNTPYQAKDETTLSQSPTSRCGNKGTARCHPGHSSRCVPTCARTGTRILSASNARRSRPGPWRPSSFFTSSAAS
jgi:hypothetical protein